MDPNALFSNQIRSQLDQLFLQRKDGDWNYYPFGFAKPGYRVDSALRQKLLSEPLFPTRGFLVVIPMIVVGTWFIHNFENKLLFAAVIGLLLIVLYETYRRGRLKIILSNSPERVPGLSNAERRQRDAENWRHYTLQQKCLGVGFGLVIVMLPAWYSWAHFFDPIGIAWWVSKFALLAVLFGLWLLYSVAKLALSSARTKPTVS